MVGEMPSNMLDCRHRAAEKHLESLRMQRRGPNTYSQKTATTFLGVAKSFWLWLALNLVRLCYPVQNPIMV